MDAAHLVEIETAQHDWASLREISGTAERIPAALRRLLGALSPEDASAAYWHLENYVVVQGQLFESAVAVTNVLMAALVSSNRPEFVRISMLELLFQITAGESHESEIERGLSDLGEQCRCAARAGLWLLYRELIENDMVGAAEIILLVDREPERLHRVQRWMERAKTS